MKKAIRIFDVILFGVSIIIFSLIIYGEYFLPKEVITYNDSKDFFGIYSFSHHQTTATVSSQTSKPKNDTLKIFGIVPVKDVTITHKEEQKVFVSGEVFGIKIYTNGVIVVGTQNIETKLSKSNPAKNAGIEIGDIIISINNTKVFTSDDVKALLNDNNGKSYKIKVKRGDRYKEFTLSPAYSTKEGCYKAGLWVRDSSAGIGTITFYNNTSKTFAALGHQVNDVDTNEMIPILKGSAVKASVTGITKGNTTTPGSLECDFSSNKIGEISKNTTNGIYGKYDKINEGAKLFPIASLQEIKKGNAQIISTIDGAKPKAYDVEITHITYRENSTQKNIILRITDPELINQTGGIVQGMSGSPVIQNGKLVGALTHVIISNSKKGYAIFAQTMYEQSITP